MYTLDDAIHDIVTGNLYVGQERAAKLGYKIVLKSTQEEIHSAPYERGGYLIYTHDAKFIHALGSQLKDLIEVKKVPAREHALPM